MMKPDVLFKSETAIPVNSGGDKVVTVKELMFNFLFQSSLPSTSKCIDAIVDHFLPLIVHCATQDKSRYSSASGNDDLLWSTRSLPVCSRQEDFRQPHR
ncbi:unnamed protein product [Phytophthora lilii]|uniref:Unnamed protein product n=1 Tax=Phytophthora lilii TaxID=2077276 RepID=A0A9W6TED4_9STRA|nr:unnamed protein product [Phytophthora lilii]